jgi:hypothetical protein
MDFSSVATILTALPTDWIIIGTCTLLLLVDALRVGSGRIAALALAALVTLLISGYFDKAAFLGSISDALSTPTLQAAVFGVLFVLLFILLRRINIDYGEESGQPLHAIIAGVAATAIVVVVWIQVPVLETVWVFGDQVQALFGESNRFWILLTALAALAFSRT